MADQQYTYAVARIRSRELALFGKQILDQLMACKSYEDCLRFLADKGWGDPSGSPEELLSAERGKMWALMRELVEDTSVFGVFLYENDYHNLKAAIKQVCTGQKVPGIFMDKGLLEPSLIFEAVQEKDFTKLPEEMRQCAEEAYEIQLKTRDSQLCDVVIDHAAMEAILAAGKRSGNELFAGYSLLKVAAADISIAIRGCRTGKSRDFLSRALVPCETLDISVLIQAALESEEAVYAYLKGTAYADGVEPLKKSLSEFERWCSNRIIQHIRPQKYNPFTISPLAAYILAREYEIKAVRIILSGKRNDLPEESVRERLTELYV
ncbi:V-type ATPase subunit [Oscillospiraceae bacterium MB08-C2-2]|nr:V-type ATPase subunit [Oscillospiraceae bacterium MB08-C2-2]